MEIPEALRAALEQQVQYRDKSQLLNDAKALSMRYRTQKGTGKSLLTADSEALAYATARMPATYGAVLSALNYSLACMEHMPETLLDAGAGTGAASWAADSVLPLRSIVCLEREVAMRRIGEELMQSGSTSLQNAQWIDMDLTVGSIAQKAGLVIASYVLNEMTREARRSMAEMLWDTTEMLLLIIEPGTPTGYANLLELREILLERGAHLAAPCTHENECRVPQGDWCHFTCRIPRSRLHRRLKEGDAPFEDEKFMYMAFTRDKPCMKGERILRHPKIHGGYVELEVCAADGIHKIITTKKDGTAYKEARKLKAGDSR